MNKADLINRVAETTGLEKKEATKAVSATFEAIEKALATGEDVQLVGFGKFAVKTSAAREAFNPQTKGSISVPEKKRVSFRAGAYLKDAVNAADAE